MHPYTHLRQQDDFIQYFVSRPSNRPPLINRGHYSRVASVRKIIAQFLAACEHQGGNDVCLYLLMRVIMREMTLDKATLDDELRCVVSPHSHPLALDLKLVHSRCYHAQLNAAGTISASEGQPCW